MKDFVKLEDISKIYKMGEVEILSLIHISMISMECEDESVSMYGIKVGTTFNEVKSAMKNCGWPPFANYNSGESGKSIFYLKDFDGGRYYFQIRCV